MKQSYPRTAQTLIQCNPEKCKKIHITSHFHYAWQRRQNKFRSDGRRVNNLRGTHNIDQLATRQQRNIKKFRRRKNGHQSKYTEKINGI